MEPQELERYGQPYWKCPECEYGSFRREATVMHLNDHVVRPTLDEVLAQPKPRKQKE